MKFFPIQLEQLNSAELIDKGKCWHCLINDDSFEVMNGVQILTSNINVRMPIGINDD